MQSDLGMKYGEYNSGYAPVQQTIQPSEATLLKRNDRRWGFQISPRAPLIILAQVALFAFAWTFYLVVAAKKNPIVLHLGVAKWISENPNITTLIITTVATALASLSTYLFTSAIRHATVVALTRSISIFMLGLSIQMSNRALVFHRDHLKWTLMGLLYLIVTGMLTAGWSSLLTPVAVIMDTPLSGIDIDLTSPQFNKLFATFPTDPSNFLDTTLGFSEFADNAGVASASALFGMPLIFNFDGRAYNTTTGGALAAQMGQSDSVLLNRSATITADAKIPQGINSNYSMTQQGYTADVKCNLQLLDTTTDPSLAIFYQSVIVPDPFNIGTNSTSKVVLNNFRWMTMCDGQPLWSDPATTWTNETIVALGCPNPTDTRNSTYTLLMLGQANYTGTVGPVVCSIQPKITKLEVDYGSVIETTSEDLQTPVDPNSLHIINQIAMGVVQRRFSHGQNLLGNRVGDLFLSIEESVNKEIFDSGAIGNLHMIEAYVRGVFEFSATLYRTYAFAIAFSDPTVLDDVMSTTANNTGTFHTQSMGYNHHFDLFLLILLPLTFITFATIFLVMFAEMQRLNPRQIKGNGITAHDGFNGDADFDVADPFHLLAAASAGGIAGTFSGRNDDSQRTQVTLVKDVNGGKGILNENIKECY
ncbi:hypothetical protein BDQ12DRAFT_740050 [Crucibulum laeve]|uniref:Uncharacterized protein n=1 Tax=Crucibulum laeve TaxID=68775 RepID=A0A5C3LEZ4_9AGAR|nr:hypothetical protein BDQ12DRAFT_740050 [Crucibulum laeve]